MHIWLIIFQSSSLFWVLETRLFYVFSAGIWLLRYSFLQTLHNVSTQMASCVRYSERHSGNDGDNILKTWILLSFFV